MTVGSYWRSQFSFEYVAHEGLKSLRGICRKRVLTNREESNNRTMVEQSAKRQ